MEDLEQGSSESDVELNEDLNQSSLKQVTEDFNNSSEFNDITSCEPSKSDVKDLDTTMVHIEDTIKTSLERKKPTFCLDALCARPFALKRNSSRNSTEEQPSGVYEENIKLTYKSEDVLTKQVGFETLSYKSCFSDPIQNDDSFDDTLENVTLQFKKEMKKQEIRENEKQMLEMKFSQLQIEDEKKEQKIKTLEDALENKQLAEKEFYEKEKSTMELKINQLEAEIRIKNEQIKSLEDALENKQVAEKEFYERENSMIELKINLFEAEIKTKNEQIQSLENQITRTKTEQEIFMSEFKKLQDAENEMEKLKLFIKNEKIRTEQLEDELKKVKIEREVLEDEVKKIREDTRNEIHSLTEALKNEKMKTKQDEIESLKNYVTLKQVRGERDEAIQQLEITKSDLDEERNKNTSIQNLFSKVENEKKSLERELEQIIAQSQSKINTQDELIKTHKDMADHARNDLQKAWKENAHQQAQLDTFKAKNEKFEKKYATMKENNEKMTERLALALEKLAQEKKKPKWSLAGKLKRRRSSKIDPEKLMMEFDQFIDKMVDDMNDDVSFNSAISVLDVGRLKEDTISGPLESTLGLLEYRQNKGYVWLEYYVTVRNNNILFYPPDNYQKENPKMVINTSKLLSVHSAISEDVPKYVAKDISLIFRALYKVDKNEEEVDDCADGGTPDTSTIKTVLLLANSKDDHKRWVQRLSRMITDSASDTFTTRRDSGIHDSYTSFRH